MGIHTRITSISVLRILNFVFQIDPRAAIEFEGAREGLGWSFFLKWNLKMWPIIPFKQKIHNLPILVLIYFPK